MANSSILLDNDEKTEVPAAVRLAQQQGFLSMEQNSAPFILFHAAL